MDHRTGLHVVEHVPEEPAAPAPLVVIVHGAMDRSASFGRVARQLRHLHLVRYDRRGYGRSAHLPPGTLHDQVDDLLAIVDGRPATIFGHSIGGVVALVAAVEQPEVVRSLLVYEAPAPWATWWPKAPADPTADPEEEAEAFMRRAIGDRYWERLPARTRRERRSEGAALLADIASISGAAPFDPGAVRSPVLVAVGSDTTWWHARAARELADALPDATLEVVAGSEHGPHLSHPTATAHLVERAVAAADLGPSPQR